MKHTVYVIEWLDYTYGHSSLGFVKKRTPSKGQIIKEYTDLYQLGSIEDACQFTDYESISKFKEQLKETYPNHCSDDIAIRKHTYVLI